MAALKRPEQRLIDKFHVGQVGNDSVRTFLENGFSLVICCKACPRMIEWTPPQLEEKFRSNLGTRIAALVPRLACVGEEGCGSHEVAVFPHVSDVNWDGPHSSS